MCLIAWYWQPASPARLVLLSNRDEFYNRPALPLHWWPNSAAAVLAGKDLQAGGTWLGVNRNGRLAALTNYRTATPPRPDAPSRGELVADFLDGNLNASDYLEALRQRASDYNPFNLLVFDGQALLGLESRSARIVEIAPGIGGVSNADFHTPWPKLTQLQYGLHQHLLNGDASTEHLFSLLHDTTLASDSTLPQTGIPIALERALSAIFITSPEYGTRASSVIRIGLDHVDFTEESFGPNGLLGTQQTRYQHGVEAKSQNMPTQP